MQVALIRKTKICKWLNGSAQQLFLFRETEQDWEQLGAVQRAASGCCDGTAARSLFFSVATLVSGWVGFGGPACQLRLRVALSSGTWEKDRSLRLTSCGNKQRPTKWYEQRLFIPSLPKQGCQPPPLGFGRDSKASKGEGNLESVKKGRLQVCPDWRLLSWGSWRQAAEVGYVCCVIREGACLVFSGWS